MLTLADMILDDKTVIEKKARTEGRVEGKAEGIAEGISVALKHAPDANLQEDFHITQEQEYSGLKNQDKFLSILFPIFMPHFSMRLDKHS